MKSIRKMLLLLLLLLLVGCSVGTEMGEPIPESEKISLNLSQADLIASITDNKKYLNEKYLYNVNTLNDSDIISVIITVKEDGLIDYYQDDNLGYSSINSYADSEYAITKVNKMLKEQNDYAQDLLGNNYINEINHSYTTLFNGFSAKTTYGQFKKMSKAGLDVKVTISEAYSEPEYQEMSSSSNTVTNIVNVYDTGIFDSSNVDYDGENTAVAILDSGFDIHHTVFQNMPKQPMITLNDVNDILYNTKAYSYDETIKAQDIYINEKIPFVYDYADKDTDVAPYDSDHGTHVAGIIGGSDSVITGVAVNTQLVLMKVFADINNGAVQEDILAALEDALLLGVDAINLSLGTSCGFSRSDDKEYINEVYDKIEAAGISLIVAASNDYSSGYGGPNSNTNKASNPDSATVGSPGSYASTMSVASISGVKSKYVIDGNGYTFFFNDANNSTGDTYDFYEMLFNATNNDKDTVEIEYVTVPGVGKKVNYNNIDVKGKIALVKRGDTSFEEKAQVAYSQGAIGCIIYNNISGDIYMNAGTGLKIALASISKDDGEYLAAKETGILTFSKSYLAGPFMSDFSSWGPVSDLTLKPEITAHGGSILSSVPGGGYEEISGTSMACPNLCGIVILVRQALKERYQDKNASEINVMTNQLLMSTGTIVIDEYGNAYSPRKQGAGLGNLENALDTKAYLSVEGSTKTKIELKDDPEETGIYELVFEINNISNETLKYSLSNLTMTESLSVSDPEYIAEKAYMLSPEANAVVTGDGQLNDDIITINANGKVTVKYTIKLSDEDRKYFEKSFINGMYVEGFAVLESLNDDIDLSIPFLAFYGDWTQAPMFDKTYFEVESEAYNASIDDEDKIKADFYATTPLGTYYYSYYVPLGSFVYNIDESIYSKIPASEEHCAISYDLETINGITTVYAGLLRNAKKMTTIITNATTGEVIYEYEKYDNHKAYYSGSIIPGYDIINLSSTELGLQSNVKYTFTMIAELDYGDGGASSNLNNTFEFSFYIDAEAPTITDCKFYTKYDKTLKDYRYYVDVEIYDNHYAQSIRPFTIIDGVLTSLSEYVIPIYSDERGGTSKVTVEITDYMDLLQYGTSEDGKISISNGLGFLVDDYALNQSYTFVTLPGTNSTNIAYKDEYYSSFSKSNATYNYIKDLYVGDELDLTTMLTSDDETLVTDEIQAKYFASLSWSSSDENIIKVNRGQIEAVSSGTATITCTALGTDGYSYSIKLKIKVRDKDVKTSANKLTDIKFTYFKTLKAFADGPKTSEIGHTGESFFVTEKPTISFYPSEQIQLFYNLEPWNLKYDNLIWSSTNEKVATVSEDGVVTALKEGNATITLKVSVNGKVSTLMASIKVTVNSEFIIEGTTLVGYKGLGGDVVIPDDEGILYIGAYAFSLYSTDYNIKIDDDDYDAAKTPDINESIKSVVIPGDVKEVKKYAFYNCTSLEKVVFLKNDDGDTCTYIREYAFAEDKNLKEINLDNMILLGNYSFSGCESLNNINISKVYAIGEYAFKDCTSLTYVDLTALRNIGEGAFSGCKSLEKIDSCEFTNYSEAMFKDSGLVNFVSKSDRIPSNCFENCSDLQTVIIENDIIYIGKNTFANCTSLKTVKFNDNVTTEFIYENAFANCTSLTDIILPDGEFEFENNVFNNCSSLTNVVFNKNTYINDNWGSLFSGCNSLSTFNVNSNNSYYQVKDNLLLNKDGNIIVLAAPNYDYNNYVIPSNIDKISYGAFSGLNSITKITINNDLDVYPYAFADCVNLEKVVLGDNNTILEYAFKGCIKLSDVENMNSLSSISAYAFSETALKSIELDNVIIEEGAFSNIDTLETINIKANGIIGDYAFSNSKALKTVYVSADGIGNYAFLNCVALDSIIIDKILVINDYAFTGCIALKQISSSTVQIIGEYAFADCLELSNISFDNVKEIGIYAFSTTTEEKGNALATVSFGDSLEKIGDYAFYQSTTLENVNIGTGLKEIGEYAFANCIALTTVTINSKDLKVLTEGVFSEDYNLRDVNLNNVEIIEDYAFIDCNKLETISLDTVEEIGVQAFNNCYALTDVNLAKARIVKAGAFMNAIKLASINMPVIEEIYEQAFSLIDVNEIKIPSSITLIATSAFFNNQKQTKFVDVNGNDTCRINKYAILDEGVLYTVTENNKYLLTAYPTGKTETNYEVLFGTVRIDEFAGAYNEYIESIIFPDTLKLLGNNCFYKAIKLNTVEFRSTTAPAFEGTRSGIYSEDDFEYDSSSEIYKYLNKYLQLNGYYPLYYGQFKDLVGLSSKMNLIIPGNDDVTGYDTIIFKLYFDLDNITISDYEALNTKSIDYLDKVSKISKDVKLSDEQIIKDARTAYNLLNQDLTKYGYEKAYLAELYANLENAENKWNEMNSTRINKAYAYVIGEISALGSTYTFDKLSKYYKINEILDTIERNDKKYIDVTNVESFKKGFENYFKGLNEDINTINDISTLPVTTVNKVGLVASLSLGAIVFAMAGIIIKRKFF